jgi:hypothetical protein
MLKLSLQREDLELLKSASPEIAVCVSNSLRALMLARAYSDQGISIYWLDPETMDEFNFVCDDEPSNPELIEVSVSHETLRKLRPLERMLATDEPTVILEIALSTYARGLRMSRAHQLWYRRHRLQILIWHFLPEEGYILTDIFPALNQKPVR